MEDKRALAKYIAKVDCMEAWRDFHVESNMKHFDVITDWYRDLDRRCKRAVKQAKTALALSIISLLLSIANLIW